MIELYQRDMWLDDWNGRPFDNALWLRNPSIEQNHLVTYKTTIRDGREVAIEPRVETGVAPTIIGELPKLRSYFLQDQIGPYFREPPGLDALLTLNDGGVAYRQQVSAA
jgi:hypothetical protein